MLNFLRKRGNKDEVPVSDIADSKLLDDAPGIDNITKQNLVDIAKANNIKVSSKLNKQEIYNILFGGN